MQRSRRWRGAILFIIIDVTSHSKGYLTRGRIPKERARVELAADTRDGRRPHDGARHRRGLSTTHGLYLRVIGHRDGRRVRSAISRHGPITTSPHAHRRSSTLPRQQRRGPPSVAEASGAHRAGGASRAAEYEPHPNENRLVAPRVALGRVSRRRRRVFSGRRACAGRSARRWCS